MAINQRLMTLERQAAQLPRSVDELQREWERQPAKGRLAWLELLTEAESDNLHAEWRLQYKAAGLPDYDMSALTDAELERIVEGDETPLETCPLNTYDLKG